MQLRDRQTNRQVSIKQAVVRKAGMQTERRNIGHVGKAGSETRRHVDKQAGEKIGRHAGRQARR
jgi:hypothetical protein